MSSQFRRVGRIVVEVGPRPRGQHPIGCGSPRWAARHVWWRLYWVTRFKGDGA